MERRSRIAGRLGFALALTSVTALGTAALAPAAFASQGPGASAPASRITDQVVRPNSYGDCTDILETFGYGLTVGRVAACGVAALALPTEAKAIAACTASMIATRVSPVTSAVACTAGTFA